MKLTLPRGLLEFSGNTHLSKRPMFISYRPEHHKVTGKEVRLVLDAIQPADILVRRYDGYLNTIFTPGFWGHAAFVETKDSIIHAVSQGVVREDILEFCRCDSIGVLRRRSITPEQAGRAVEIARQFLQQGWEYDYRFERGNGRLYCTELADSCHNGLYYDEFSTEMGNFLLLPDNLFNSVHNDKILVIKH